MHFLLLSILPVSSFTLAPAREPALAAATVDAVFSLISLLGGVRTLRIHHKVVLNNFWIAI